MHIVVRGDSVAAWCCAYLLKKAGFKPWLKRTGRARVPAIMLSDAAVTLIRDVFDRADLFVNAPRISRRVVQWGKNTEPLTLAHSAVVVSERELLHELELEFADSQLLTAAAVKRNDEGCPESERSAFDELIRAFVNNARILARNADGGWR